jgi:hypothetical protein
MSIDHLNVEELKALPDDEPVTILNLMCFRERSLHGNGRNDASGIAGLVRFEEALGMISPESWTSTASRPLPSQLQSPKLLRKSEGSEPCGARRQRCSLRDSIPWCSG